MQPVINSAPETGRATNLSAFIWSVADLLRGDYRQSDYGKVILPFTVLRRLDCVLEPTKAAVLEEQALRSGQGLDPEPFLLRKAGQLFCNTSALDMKRLMGDQDNIGENLRSYARSSRASSFTGKSNALRRLIFFTSSPRSSPRSTSTPRR